MVKTPSFPRQGFVVSLLGELRSLMPPGAAKNTVDAVELLTPGSPAPRGGREQELKALSSGSQPPWVQIPALSFKAVECEAQRFHHFCASETSPPTSECYCEEKKSMVL